MSKVKRTKKVNRSADTGQFVSDEFAEENPKETYADTVPVKSNIPNPTGITVAEALGEDLDGEEFDPVTNEHLAGGKSGDGLAIKTGIGVLE